MQSALDQHPLKTKPEASAAPSGNSATPPPAPSLSRRVFIRTGLTVLGSCYAAALGYPIYRYLAADARQSALEGAQEIVLPDVDQIAPGSALMFEFGGRPSLLIHHADGSWTALSAVCTHLGCTVQFDGGSGRILCACHGGVFDARTGQNIAGPPPKPLPRYNVAVSEGKAVVTRA